MNDITTSAMEDKISGAVSTGLANALERQSPSLAAAKKYQERYLSKNRIRAYKRVYISDDMFSLLTRIVCAVGKEKASVGNYVSEIVRDHIERNKETVNTVYLTNTQPLF